VRENSDAESCVFGAVSRYEQVFLRGLSPLIFFAMLWLNYLAVLAFEHAWYAH
jgi:hypothetical protein